VAIIAALKLEAHPSLASITRSIMHLRAPKKL